jgi:hypothetical protein
MTQAACVSIREEQRQHDSDDQQRHQDAGRALRGSLLPCHLRTIQISQDNRIQETLIPDYRFASPRMIFCCTILI